MAVRVGPGDPALALAPGARLLHVGLPKTGTTALQRTAAQRRPELLRQGVLYPGTRYNHRRAGYAFEQRSMAWGEPAPGQGAWRKVVAEIRAEPDRRVWLDNESFYDLPAERAGDLLREVGGEPHVVLTMRSIPAQLASSWSEYLKTGLRVPFGRWVEGVLSDPPKPGLTPSFPRRNDLSRLVTRWAELVGPDRVTVVVLDPADRDLVPHAFETMLGLEAGTLQAVELAGDDANRSFTLAEAELVRGLNGAVRKRADVEFPEFDRFVRASAMVGLMRRRPERDEPRIVPPRWAVERTAELAEGHRTAIEAMDVRVVGDLAHLALPVEAVDEVPRVRQVPLAAAHAALMASIEAGIEADRAARSARLLPEPAPAAPGAPAPRPAVLLVRGLARRARRSLRRRLRR